MTRSPTRSVVRAPTCSVWAPTVRSLSPSGAVLNHEATASYTLTLTATDDATLPMSATAMVNIAVRDLNESPAFSQNSYTRTVNENSGAGTGVGGPITATDPDDGDVLQYALSWHRLRSIHCELVRTDNRIEWTWIGSGLVHSHAHRKG